MSYDTCKEANIRLSFLLKIKNKRIVSKFIARVLIGYKMKKICNLSQYVATHQYLKVDGNHIIHRSRITGISSNLSNPSLANCNEVCVKHIWVCL